MTRWKLLAPILVALAALAPVQAQLGALFTGDKKQDPNREQVTVRVRGRVTGGTAGTITVESNGLKFTVRTTGAKASGSIARGDAVQVDGELVTGMVVLAETITKTRLPGPVTDPPSATKLSGTVTKIRRKENHLTLQTSTGQVEIHWTESTQMLLGGKKATVDDVKVGRTITVTGTRKGPDSWTVTLINVDL